MKTCGACEEQWEDDFFCDKCSTKIWTYNGDDFIEPEDICLNCCSGHLKGDNMKINKVSVHYGELRSLNFDNKRIEIGLSASVDPGESARKVELRLFELAKNEVKKLFGDPPDQICDEMDVPF